MKHITQRLASFLIARPWLQYVLVAVAYALLTVYYYLGPAVVSCSDTLPTGIGDATAGLIWLNHVDNKDPWWGMNMESNFPFGEQLGQPFHILGQAVYIPYWVVSKIFGAICGYNILTAAGFIFSALSMFFFIRWLTKRFWIAFIAGIAVAFTPYLQYKTGLHPAYVFQGVFILFIWLFLVFWRKPTRKSAIGLGLLAAAFFYTDPYFILLGGVLGVGLVGFATFSRLLSDRRNGFKVVRRRYLYLLISGLVLGISLLPIAYVQKKYSEQINSVVSSSRSDIRTEAEIYGARPEEYLLPNRSQPLLASMFGEGFTLRDDHGSNIGETLLSISLTMLAVAMILWVVVLRKLRQPKELKGKDWRLAGFSAPTLLSIFTGTGVVAFLCSLPPKLGAMPTPVYFLIEVTSIWRVFSRLQVIVVICLVILAAIGLAIFLRKYKSKRLQVGVLVLILIGVLFEYQSFPVHREVWTYRDAPKAYYWLKEQSDVNAAAEYPLDEPAKTIYPTYYFSYQLVHGKNLLNAITPGSPQSVLRNALRDLDAPQTVPVLRALGINAVLVHSKEFPGDIEGLEAIQEVKDANSRLKANEYVWAYRVLPGPTQQFLLAPDAGFNDLKIAGPRNVGYQVSKKAKLIFYPLPSQPADKQQVQVSFDASLADVKHPQYIVISQGGRTVWEGGIKEAQRISFGATTAEPIEITAPVSDVEGTIVLRHITLEKVE